jgi:type VI secretion system protein ImpM
MSERPIRIGFFGKLPSRGDFVRFGLSQSATTAWDQWLQAVLPKAEAWFGDNWSEIWRAVRPWRFTFGPGVCGPVSLSGLWLPSIDKVGRTFPLLIAAEVAPMVDTFFDEGERIGAEAIAEALPPEALIQRIGLAPRRRPAEPRVDGAAAHWWRQAGPERVELHQGDGLPDDATFVRMLTP